MNSIVTVLNRRGSLLSRLTLNGWSELQLVKAAYSFVAYPQRVEQQNGVPAYGSLHPPQEEVSAVI